MVTYLATKFINTPADQMDESIDSLLEAVGRYANVDRSYLFLLSDDKETWSNTHEWCATGISRQQENLQALPLSAAPWWLERLQNGEVIRIPRVSDLPPEAIAERDLLEAQDVKSLLVFPLGQTELQGFFGFDCVKSEKDWSDFEISVFQVAGEVVSNLLQRKRSEETLRRSERLYRLLADNVADLIWTTDVVGRPTYLSPSVTRMTGFTVEEAMQRDIKVSLAPDSLSLSQRAFARLAEGIEMGRVPQYSKPIEFEIYRKDGSAMWLEVIVKPLRDEEGTILGLVGLGRDTTERRRVYQALRRANRALMVLSRCNEIVVRATNEQDLLDQICRVIVDVGGYRVAWVGLTGENSLQVAAWAESGSVQISKRGVLQGREGEQVMNCVRLGTPRVIQDTAADPALAPSLLETGHRGMMILPLTAAQRCLGALSIYAPEANRFDDSEGALLMELANDLAYGMHTLRTRKEREEAQLRASEYKELMTLKSNLLSAVSHELRTPLAIIKGYSGMLLDHGSRLDSQEKTEYVGAIDSG